MDLYIARVVAFKKPYRPVYGRRVFKVGITSNYCKRINGVANVVLKPLIRINVQSARAVEARVLKRGGLFTCHGVRHSGVTEYRTFTPQQLKTVIRLVLPYNIKSRTDNYPIYKD